MQKLEELLACRSATSHPDPLRRPIINKTHHTFLRSIQIGVRIDHITPRIMVFYDFVTVHNLALILLEQHVEEMKRRQTGARIRRENVHHFVRKVLPNLA